LTGASDNLREAGGNAVTGYTFSSLEQYIPLFLMQTVRVIASGDGIVSKSPLTLNGVEALDRSGSVLYRDLKGATSFGTFCAREFLGVVNSFYSNLTFSLPFIDHSFWDDELAAISFERSASFMAMMEVEMEEVCALCREVCHWLPTKKHYSLTLLLRSWKHFTEEIMKNFLTRISSSCLA
jgi:hypothetical protein